jgi:hypothetical protein
MAKVGKSDCEGTFARSSGNERDAPKPDISLETILLPLDPAADAPHGALRAAGAPVLL